MSDARRYAVWPEPTSRSRSLKGSRPSVPHGTNFFVLYCTVFYRLILLHVMLKWCLAAVNSVYALLKWDDIMFSLK